MLELPRKERGSGLTVTQIVTIRSEPKGFSSSTAMNSNFSECFILTMK